MFDLFKDWEIINYFIYFGLLLFVAKLIKEKVPLLNKIIIPSALIAGFIGLILSDGFVGIVNISDPSYDVYDKAITEVSDEELSKIIVVDYTVLQHLYNGSSLVACSLEENIGCQFHLAVNCPGKKSTSCADSQGSRSERLLNSSERRSFSD